MLEAFTFHNWILVDSELVYAIKLYKRIRSTLSWPDKYASPYCVRKRYTQGRIPRREKIFERILSQDHYQGEETETLWNCYELGFNSHRKQRSLPNQLPSFSCQIKAYHGYNDATFDSSPKKSFPTIARSTLPIYQKTDEEFRVLEEYINEFPAIGFIRKSKSPAGAPVLFVPKKNEYHQKSYLVVNPYNKLDLGNSSYTKFGPLHRTPNLFKLLVTNTLNHTT
ncbi:hypothetical protein H8356DRAFT_1360747 [Neocallimastix lanati (nom. inval.)]|nr:hypothetical protein H8356DRAFT_1360747 [Neocallimastix sp. JGI-2020a]